MSDDFYKKRPFLGPTCINTVDDLERNSDNDFLDMDKPMVSHTDADDMEHKTDDDFLNTDRQNVAEDVDQDPDRATSSLECSSCRKMFKNRKTLRKHVLKFHPAEIQSLCPSLKQGKVFQFPCNVCSKQYNDIYNLRLHEKTAHGIIDTKSDDCPMCHFKGSKKDLKIHFEADHDIDIEEETLQFESENDFVAWKAKLENDHAVSYVKERGVAHTTAGVEKQFFICNRSGYYKCKGKGLRHLKTQGSRKINGYCPAGFTVNSSADGCLVKYIKTHIGHTNEIGHLSLTEKERSFFAAKIATGISFNKILDDIRDNIPSSGIRRVHLLTNKDLHNIQMEFEVEACGLKSDAASIDLWVNHKDNKDVLFYKFQEYDCPKHQNLQSDDFVLIIMTEAQREMLTKYAPECICIDSTHGTNAYDFQLTTLLVLDDMRQGLPCAFMISSKVNQDTCAVFFSEIKDVIGDISTAIFMSDMAETYYNAWLSTFHTVPTNRLYCAWHVDNAWRNNLNKIKNQDLRVFVYKILKTLMYETDVNTFEVLLTKTKDMFSLNDELKQFGDYFFQFYGQNSACWAYCYRTNLGINTNMHLESMHRTLKYIYFKGKKVKRLDKSVIQIMKFIRDKLFDRLVILHKGKLVPKLSDLRLRHQTSLALSLDFVSEINDSFIVLSSNDPATTYMVKKNNKSCTCRLRCDECDSCLHAYTCTCIDASIKNNMCKHIHLTCRYLQSKQCIDKVGVEATSLCIDTDKADKDFEENVIVTELLKESGSVNISLIEAKEDLIKKFSDMIYGIKDASEVKILNDTYKSAQVKLLAHHNSTTPLNPLPPTKKRKIAPQRRLFSVKSKRVKRNNAISNPTVQESQDIALSLIMPK